MLRAEGMMARVKKTSAQSEPPAAATPEPQAPPQLAAAAEAAPAGPDGFSRGIGVATLLLVALVALLAFLDLRSGDDAEASDVRNDIATLSQSLSDARADVARVESKVDALAAPSSAPAPTAEAVSEPPTQAAQPRRVIDRSKCMRVFRPGARPRWECGR
jgi:hypothetical protein